MRMTSELRPAQSRSRKLAIRCALIAACGVLAAACGSTAAPGSSASSGSHSASTTAAAKASLDIVLSAPGGAVQHWTLRCDPPGGTHPDAEAVCQKLIADKSLWAPVKVKVMCPMIMASAQSFVITGTWFGKSVHETILDGGCGLYKWVSLHQIFN